MMHDDPAPIFLLDEKRAAASLGLTPRTLQEWRRRGGGPPYVRVSSRCIRYMPEDLLAWAAERKRASTSAESAADHSRA